jgi:hypothetical protein
MFTVYMKCLNETTYAKAVQAGVQQFYVDPSCQLELKNHSLTSELSMKLDVEVTYFPWKFADLKAFSVTEEDITAALEGRTTSGERNLFLADVMQHKHFSSKNSSVATGNQWTSYYGYSSHYGPTLFSHRNSPNCHISTKYATNSQSG